MTDPEASARVHDADRLTRELVECELHAQRLRDAIVAIRETLAAGHVATALSLCHQALNEIDSATDVAAPSPRQKSS
jgi:hypothetical protein